MPAHVDTKKLQALVLDLSGIPDSIMPGAYRYFVSQTPIRSGRARRSTRLVGQEIQANYPYAGQLDQGSSGQAPDGMSGPTRRYIQDHLRREIQKRGK